MFNLQENYKERFVLPDPNETAGFSAEDLADDMEGLIPKYPRLRIVPGGANQFEIVGDPDDPQLERQLDCIILFRGIHRQGITQIDSFPHSDGKVFRCANRYI